MLENLKHLPNVLKYPIGVIVACSYFVLCLTWLWAIHPWNWVPALLPVYVAFYLAAKEIKRCKTLGYVFWKPIDEKKSAKALEYLVEQAEIERKKTKPLP